MNSSTADSRNRTATRTRRLTATSKDSRVTSVIVGASSKEQLDANLKAIGNTVFCDEELTQINALTI